MFLQFRILLVPTGRLQSHDLFQVTVTAGFSFGDLLQRKPSAAECVDKEWLLCSLFVITE